MKNDVIKFLLGEGPLDGVWFGDKHPTERGMFWWRNHLRVYLKLNQPNSSNTVLCKPEASAGAQEAAVGQRSVGTNAEAGAVDEYARGFEAGCKYILLKYNINGHRAEAPSEGHL